MIEKKFSVGDLVRLKSGSPDMTVASEQADEKVECAWFQAYHGVGASGAYGDCRAATFHVSALCKAMVIDPPKDQPL